MLPPIAKSICRYAGLRCELNGGFRMGPMQIATLRQKSYVDQWRCVQSEGWFHVRFEDNSTIAFGSSPNASFHYMDCPLAVPTYPEYLEYRGDDFRDRHNPRTREEYEDVLATASLRSTVTPMRYDCDFGSYRAGVHPAAHLHIGLENEIRLGLKRELSPLAFLLFVIRQRYPINWERLLESTMEKRLRRHVRSELPVVSTLHFGSMDHNEMYLE